MPAPALAALAKKAGVSMDKAEAAYEEAKKAAAKTYDKSTEEDKFYGTVMKIVKKKLGLKEGRSIDDINLLIEKCEKKKMEEEDDGEDANPDKPADKGKKKEDGEEDGNNDDEDPVEEAVSSKEEKDAPFTKSGEKAFCPHCGENIGNPKTKKLSQTKEYHLYKCGNCGGLFKYK